MRLRVTQHLYQHADAERGVIVIDPRSGECHAMNTSAATVWAALSAGDGFEGAVTVLQDRYPTESVERVRHDVAMLIEDMLQAGLITIEERDRTAGVRMASRPAGVPGPVGMLFLLLAVTLLALPFRVPHGLVRTVHRRGGKPLSSAQAERIVRSVRRAAARLPVRAACLEVSLASVLWAACKHRRLDWCLGVLFDPYSFHAWVETEGRRIETSEETLSEPSHYRVISI
ncbi:lasso peptide biosynthesis B2 protein [Sphaerisporangium aureirubrum]|uniref:Lasso peptide biosynthesis B2 protein n=1 Tax=Sphaerisporangium aureirubrum TaxID=1544736 RepID=A0ABW1NNQ5_9ACTN